jgi:alkylhydroperoxidase/carboxymuconolactone decarboxylase family protein YurZ
LPSDPLASVAAAAALRSCAALWSAIDDALTAGVTQADIEAAIEAAAVTAAEAVRLEAKQTLREVVAREGARERWAIIDEEK